MAAPKASRSHFSCFSSSRRFVLLTFFEEEVRVEYLGIVIIRFVSSRIWPYVNDGFGQLKHRLVMTK